MNLVELKAFGMTLQLCVMLGSMSNESALTELYRAIDYAKAIDEVSK